MPPISLPAEATVGDLYHPAMTITDQAEADAYFEALVAHSMTHWGKTREEAEHTQRSNLGYFAGYYDNETRVRVERLFGGVHPVFGSTANGPISNEQAFRLGRRWGKR